MREVCEGAEGEVLHNAALRHHAHLLERLPLLDACLCLKYFDRSLVFHVLSIFEMGLGCHPRLKEFKCLGFEIYEKKKENFSISCVYIWLMYLGINENFISYVCRQRTSFLH